MSAIESTETLLVRLEDGVAYVTLNRPERKNALSPQMIEDLIQVFGALATHEGLRAVVLRGAAGTFCAGADVKAMPSTQPAPARARAGADPRRAIARNNRRFGEVLCALDAVPAPIVAVVEGSVMGGGFGLVCVSDIALARSDARFGLPETGLGLIPAQIAPFVVQRIGLTQARRLMLTGARFDGAEAGRLGLVHAVLADDAALEQALAATLAQIRRCAPEANAATKRLVLRASGRELARVLDEAAEVFAEASVGDEAKEGTLAFVEKRLPRWAGK